MAEYQHIVRELKALESVHSELATIATRTDDRRRHDLIDLRRRFAAQMVEVGRLAEPLFAAAQDQSLHQAYRDYFSRMRSTAATHQANWPAVRIDESVDQYRQSAQGVTEAHRQFIKWMHEALVKLERGG